jgi:catechol 2,3-dioxygenase-like lactoylglutathione lyase family enzyme
MPSVSGVLETSLYVDDLERSAEFYRRLFQFRSLTEDEKLVALSVDGRQVLLLFRRGSTTAPARTRGGTIPGHNGTGELHVAFSISESEYAAWCDTLRENRVEVESEVTWLAGGRSLYFRDPDRNLIELVTPRTWSIY